MKPIERLSALWRVWNTDPFFARSRSVYLRLMTPVLIVTVIALLIVHAWSIAAVLTVTLAIAIGGILRKT